MQLSRHFHAGAHNVVAARIELERFADGACIDAHDQTQRQSPAEPRAGFSRRSASVFDVSGPVVSVTVRVVHAHGLVN